MLADTKINENILIPNNWLEAYPIGYMIEYTSKCNLRCKYCTKSNPGDDLIPGRDMDMTIDNVENIIKFLENQKLNEILLAGTGESTFHPKWTEDFPKIINAAKKINNNCQIKLNTNLALDYKDVHFEILSQIDVIIISIDTSSRELTKAVRSKSDLGLIIHNILKLKSYCELKSMKIPALVINITLYQKAVSTLPELINILSDLPISHVSISDCFETTGAKKYGIEVINDSNISLFTENINDIRKSIDLAKSKAKFTISIQPYLVDRLNKLISKITNKNESEEAQELIKDQKSVRQTKICLQPWTRFTVAANGDLYPCCVTDMPPVGKVTNNCNDQTHGINGEKFKAFRSALLRGEVPAVCKNCTNAPDGSVEQLGQALSRLIA